jgi:hypothetical protein
MLSEIADPEAKVTRRPLLDEWNRTGGQESRKGGQEPRRREEDKTKKTVGMALAKSESQKVLMPCGNGSRKVGITESVDAMCR